MERKKLREDRLISDDASIIIGSFLHHKDVGELRAMKISPLRLIDEIRKYDPSFTLEDHLMKKRRRRESLGYILYGLIKGLSWSIEVINDSYTTNGVNPMTISQLYMYVRISDIQELNATKIISHFDIRDNVCTKYPIKVWYKNSEKCMTIKLDIDDYTIPNELIYLREKDKISSMYITDNNMTTFEYNREVFKPKPKWRRIYYE